MVIHLYHEHIFNTLYQSADEKQICWTYRPHHQIRLRKTLESVKNAFDHIYISIHKEFCDSDNTRQV